LGECWDFQSFSLEEREREREAGIIKKERGGDD